MNNISIGGVQPDKNTGAYMPAGPTTGTYQNPANDFVEKKLGDTMQYNQPDMTSKAGSFDYQANASGGLSHQEHNLNTEGTQPTFDPSQGFISDDALVEKRLTDLLSEDNPFVKLQELKSQQAMNARGGLNTTMAAGAGRAAAIDAGLDIVRPDAATYAQADLARQSSTYQGGLSQQQAELAGRQTDQQKAYEWDTREQQGAISGDLNTQEMRGRAEQTRLEGLQQGALAEQQGRIAGEQATQAAYYEQQNAQFNGQIQAAMQTLKDGNANSQQVFEQTVGLMRDRMNLEANRLATQAQLNEQQREAFGGFVTSMAKDYEVSVQNILMNENLDSPAKKKAIADLTVIYNQDIVNLASIFGARTRPMNSGTAGAGVDPYRGEDED